MDDSSLISLKFATIPAGTYELGWRFTEMLPPDVEAALSGFLPRDELLKQFSGRRSVELGAFEIATESIPLVELLGDPYDLEDEVATIEDLCNKLDDLLRPRGFRVPIEDEIEAACDGDLFWWGMSIPDGIPYGKKTTFELHRKPNIHGLVLNGDPYNVEVVRHAFKLGDGGAAICGAYPWPLAWLALAPSWYLGQDAVEECFIEHLETARVRPIRVG